MALQVVPHMKVVEVGAPGRVSVEDRMSKARDGTVQISDDGIPVRRRPGEPTGPLGHPVSDDVTIKKRIQERAPIVASPAFSMQLSDGFSIVRCRLPILHTPIFPDPASPPAIRGLGKRERTPRTRFRRDRGVAIRFTPSAPHDGRSPCWAGLVAGEASGQSRADRVRRDVDAAQPADDGSVVATDAVVVSAAHRLRLRQISLILITARSGASWAIREIGDRSCRKDER